MKCVHRSYVRFRMWCVWCWWLPGNQHFDDFPTCKSIIFPSVALRSIRDGTKAISKSKIKKQNIIHSSCTFTTSLISFMAIVKQLTIETIFFVHFQSGLSFEQSFEQSFYCHSKSNLQFIILFSNIIHHINYRRFTQIVVISVVLLL